MDTVVRTPRHEKPELSPAAPLEGAILPTYRIVAFYGNPRSKQLGILGRLPPDRMLARLDEVVNAWESADPTTPVRPALQLIAVLASGTPGPDGKYRIRQTDRTIREVLALAKRRDALVFLDIQPGRSTVEAELPRLLEYLKLPQVHLALDPEWAMGPNGIPGKTIGSLDASDINYAIRTLARLVEENHLPPKVLVVHRFTRGMVTNLDELELDPHVQLVLDMDGWGPRAKKVNTYRTFVAPAPVPFTGFKLFFENDTRDGGSLMTPEQVLQLTPVPFYIQYQ